MPSPLPAATAIGFSFDLQHYLVLYLIPAIISGGLISAIVSYFLNSSFAEKQEKKRKKFEKEIQDLVHKRNILESWATPLLETLIEIHIALDKPEPVSAELLASLSTRARLFISNSSDRNSKENKNFEEKTEDLKRELMDHRRILQNTRSTTMQQDVMIKGEKAKKTIAEVTKIINGRREQ